MIVAAEPDNDNIARDVRRDQERRCEVRDRADRNDEQFFAASPGPRRLGDDEIDRLGTNRRHPVRQKRRCTAISGNPAAEAHEVDDPDNFPVTLLHPVGGGGRTAVQKRSRRHTAQVDALRRQQRVDERELIVDLVIGVGIQNHRHGTGAGRHGIALFIEIHDVPPWILCLLHSISVNLSGAKPCKWQSSMLL